MAWLTPKTDWSAADGVRDSDFNRIESNILELYNTAHVRAAQTIHVATTGSDTFGSGTSASPYATVTRALRDVPRDLNGNNVTISIANGSYSEAVTVRHFTNGIIMLSFTSVTFTSLTVNNARVLISGTTLTLTASSSGLIVQGRAYVKSSARIEISGGANSVLLDDNATLVTTAAIAMYDSTSRALTVRGGSFAYIHIVAGSGHAAGVLVSQGSVLAYNSLSLLVTPNVAVIATESGGRIYTGAQANNSLATAEVI